jgi:hypothetical protein
MKPLKYLAFAAVLNVSPAMAYKIVDTESVSTGGLCLIVTIQDGMQYSYPSAGSSSNPLYANPAAALGAFTLDGGTLRSAAISYGALGPNATKLYWDSGAADPNCFNLPIILNLRYTP